MMTPWLTLNQEFERRRKESKTKPGDRRKLDQANTMLLFTIPLFFNTIVKLLAKSKLN